MRITVVGEDAISRQARTYAEYRVFAALAQFAETEKVRWARVVLRRVTRKGDCDTVTCTVSVALDGSDSLRIRTTGQHAYAAINRAIARISTCTAVRMMDRASS